MRRDLVIATEARVILRINLRFDRLPRHHRLSRGFYICSAIVWLTCLLRIGLLQAADTQTPEFIALTGVRNLLTILQPGAGVVPKGVNLTNWTQVRGYSPVNYLDDLDHINVRLREQVSPDCPIEAHYVFIQGNELSLASPNDASVILIRTEPLMRRRDFGELGRYAIFRLNKTLESAVTWLPEVEVQRMLNQAGITLRCPDPADIRIAEAGIRSLMSEEAQKSRELKKAIWKLQWDALLRRFSFSTNYSARSAPGKPQFSCLWVIALTSSGFTLLAIILRLSKR